MARSLHLPWLALLRFFCVAGILILLLTKTGFVYAQVTISEATLDSASNR